MGLYVLSIQLPRGASCPIQKKEDTPVLVLLFMVESRDVQYYRHTNVLPPGATTSVPTYGGVFLLEEYGSDIMSTFSRNPKEKTNSVSSIQGGVSGLLNRGHSYTVKTRQTVSYTATATQTN